ncbi:integrating conjugative element protein [Salinisphaera orenii]|uniref:integrating conjugative element protein n=1 Tax=Salinisphaera orenii TaxID=856731 RepID=UPI000DBE2638
MAWIEQIAAAVALGLSATAASADLTVVADHGGQPAKPYYVAISSAHEAEHDGYHARAAARPAGPSDEAATLPVHSSALSPGRVGTHAIHLPPSTTPFFLIGTGELSRHWLEQRRSRLEKLHAVGLVVDVRTEAQMKRLRRLGHGLVMHPTPGNDIAQRLGMSHYPVLITPKAIQQ